MFQLLLARLPVNTSINNAKEQRRTDVLALKPNLRSFFDLVLFVGRYLSADCVALMAGM